MAEPGAVAPLKARLAAAMALPNAVAEAWLSITVQGTRSLWLAALDHSMRLTATECPGPMTLAKKLGFLKAFAYPCCCRLYSASSMLLDTSTRSESSMLTLTARAGAAMARTTGAARTTAHSFISTLPRRAADQPRSAVSL